MTPMLPDEKIKCPATGFAKSCREIVTAPGCVCPKYVQIRGKHPQTGESVDSFGCVDNFLPALLIEGAQMSRQTGAAVESLRNVVAENGDKNRAALTRIAGAPLKAIG